jgi:RNA polymerase sigma-70 factor, ECF subfamily
MATVAQPSLQKRVEENMTGAFALEPDAVLMLQVRAGDAGSFGALLGRHRLGVIHFLYRMVQNQAVAEELAQEVFLRVYKARGSYEPTARFTTWLFRIATHMALNWVRDEKGRKAEDSLERVQLNGSPRQLSDHRPSAETCLLREVRLDEIRREIARLPEKQRAAVLMHKYQELEYAQIARALGCTESAVKSLLFRAYETLRDRLAHYA